MGILTILICKIQKQFTDQNFLCRQIFCTLLFHVEIKKNNVKSLNTNNMIIKELGIEEKKVIVSDKIPIATDLRSLGI